MKALMAVMLVRQSSSLQLYKHHIKLLDFSQFLKGSGTAPLSFKSKFTFRPIILNCADYSNVLVPRQLLSL